MKEVIELGGGEEAEWGENNQNTLYMCMKMLNNKISQ